MSTSSSAGMRQFWRSDSFVGACVGAAVVVLCHAASVISTLQLRFYDLADTPSSPIAQVHAVAQKIVAMAARHRPEGGGSGVSASSYDPAAEGPLADDSSAKTAVFGRPHGSAHPPAGGGQSDSEA